MADLSNYNSRNSFSPFLSMIIPIKPWLDLLSDGASSAARLGTGYSGLALSSDPFAEELMRARGIGSFPAMYGSDSNRMEFYHEPILAGRIVEAMQPLEGKQIFDGTLGGGGHSELLLGHGAHVIGCDQDAEALSYASKRLERFGDCFLPVRGNFEDIDQILASHGIDSVDGILIDLGVSSRQLDNPERGFSFREEGDLDMRMDTRSGLTAKELVNEWSEEELARIFFEYGEERRARRVAKEIVKARSVRSIDTTLQLSEIVGRVIPKTSGKNPATKVFQAIRIAVNRELEVLEAVLEKSIAALASGGVLAVITFHSLEDRIVKQFMRRTSTPFLDRPEWPEPKENPDYHFQLPTRRAIAPGEEEVKANPRSRSAKLRIATKV